MLTFGFPSPHSAKTQQVRSLRSFERRVLTFGFPLFAKQSPACGLCFRFVRRSLTSLLPLGKGPGNPHHLVTLGIAPKGSKSSGQKSAVCPLAGSYSLPARNCAPASAPTPARRTGRVFRAPIRAAVTTLVIICYDFWQMIFKKPFNEIRKKKGTPYKKAPGERGGKRVEKRALTDDVRRRRAAKRRRCTF